MQNTSYIVDFVDKYGEYLLLEYIILRTSILVFVDKMFDLLISLKSTREKEQVISSWFRVQADDLRL